MSICNVAERPGVLADRRADPGALLRPQVLPRDRAVREGAERRAGGKGERSSKENTKLIQHQIHV